MQSHGSIDQADLPRGFAAGRYLVLDRIGAGDRGVVYAAYDPERGRKIALKFLLPSGHSVENAQQSQSRLLREAQAMARLSHPQVVPIYEIGTLGEWVFIAMEFIEGVTLAKWLRQEPHSQQEILEAFILAGRGLLAAHAAGLLQANFKLHNVFAGQDGRVCVADLGLADTQTSERVGPAPNQLAFNFERSLSTQPSQSKQLTQQADFAHASHHTAPEQHKGKPVDVRTDVFRFCAALYEALYRVPPFTDGTAHGQSINNGPSTRSSGSSGVRAPQSTVHQALLRGLYSEPDKRYASMDQLLSALSRQRHHKRWWWVGGVAAAALAVLLLLGLYVSTLVKRHQLLCSGAAAKVAKVWDASRKLAVHDALLRTGKPYAEETWDRVEQALDRYSAQWVAMHTEACQATRVRGEQSEALLDVRMQCLDRRLADLTALTQFLGRVESSWLDKVAHAAQELTPIGVCADVLALTAPVPLPEEPSKRIRLASMLGPLSETIAMQRLGQYVQAQEAGQNLVQAAHELGYPPFEAEALYWLGLIQSNRGQSRAAVGTLLRAASAGVAGRDLRIAAKAWSRLVSINGFNLQQPAEASKWEMLASSAIAALGDNPEAKFELASARCVAAYSQPTQEQTLSLCQESLNAALKVYGPSHFHVSAQMNNLADILAARNQTEQALSFYRQSLRITQQQLGNSHPSVAIHLNNLGETLGTIGKYREALPYLSQAIDIQQRVLEPGHLQRGVVLGTLGQLQWGDGQVEAAGATLQGAISILEKGFPPGHSNLVTAQITLVRVLLAQQNNLEAQRLAEQLLTPEHTEPSAIADVDYLLGQALARQQHYGEALTRHRDALALHEKTGSKAGKVSDLSAVGTDLIQLGRPQEALSLLEQAAQFGLAANVATEVQAASQFALAQALWSIHGRVYEERTISLAAAARAVFARGGHKYQVEQDEVDRWLAAQHLSIPRMPE